jgi:hypothetical protein
MPLVFNPYKLYANGKFVGEVYLAETKFFVPKPPPPKPILCAIVYRFSRN